MDRTTDYLKESARRLPVTASCDVLVCGGGIAGAAAALAAARTGAKTLLLEREYLLGGLATLGLVTIYLPLCDGVGHQVSYGIAEELLRLSVSHGMEQSPLPTAWLQPDGDPEQRREKRYRLQYNPHVFAACLERQLAQAGVRILYGTVATDTVVNDGVIEAVIVENKSGRSAVRAGSVVDATGDADICHLAGADCATFSPGNKLAAWYYYANQTDGVRLKQLGCVDVPDDEKNNETELLTARRFGGLDAAEISDMMMLAREHEMRHVLAERRRDPTVEPVTFPTIPQLRMTRRIVGVCTPDDKPTHRHETTSIGMIGDWRKRGPVYELPFGCLYGEKIRNLITAGRIISVTDALWDITRVIPACAVTGQAAGTAAAMSRDFSTLDITALQRQLRLDGVKLHTNEVL